MLLAALCDPGLLCSGYSALQLTVVRCARLLVVLLILLFYFFSKLGQKYWILCTQVAQECYFFAGASCGHLSTHSPSLVGTSVWCGCSLQWSPSPHFFVCFNFLFMDSFIIAHVFSYFIRFSCDFALPEMCERSFAASCSAGWQSSFSCSVVAACFFSQATSFSCHFCVAEMRCSRTGLLSGTKSHVLGCPRPLPSLNVLGVPK